MTEDSIQLMVDDLQVYLLGLLENKEPAEYHRVIGHLEYIDAMATEFYADGEPDE